MFSAFSDVKVETLIPGDHVLVLGRSLTVLVSHPAERGGDFWTLDARESGKGISLDLDRNTVVKAMITKEEAA